MNSIETTDLIAKEALQWVLLCHSGELSEAERQAFEVWVAQSDRHRRLYEGYERRWRGLDQFKGWDGGLRREALSYRAPPTGRRRVPLLARLALVASVLLGVGLVLNLQWVGQDVETNYATARGEHRTIELAEGSVLELNTDSAVKVRLEPTGRSVELLHGEVFFSVTHEVGRPFVVRAGNGRIEDTGTAFNVYRKPERVTVAVQEGAVRIITGPGSRELTASQTAAYDGQGRWLQVDDFRVENLTAWRRRQLLFENRPLEDVLAEFARYHDTKLRLAAPGLGKLRVSGNFHLDELDQALDTIARVVPITIQRPNPHEVVIGKR
jgi:transmembrane sensor